jgi:hypothetical protein
VRELDGRLLDMLTAFQNPGSSQSPTGPLDVLPNESGATIERFQRIDDGLLKGNEVFANG